MAKVNKKGRKWIYTSVALACMLLIYFVFALFNQLNEWFELEAKIPSYELIYQVAAIAVAAIAFFTVITNKKSIAYLDETYAEMVKVVWPESSLTSRHTVIIIIAVTIIGFLLSIFDFSASGLLSLLH